MTTLVIEAKDRAGGQPQFLYPDKRVVDIPGFPYGITGEELSERTYRQAVDAVVQFRFNEELVDIEETDQVEKEEPLKRVVTNRDAFKEITSPYWLNEKRLRDQKIALIGDKIAQAARK